MSGNTGYGITIQGFVMPQLSDLQADLQQAIFTQFGAGANVQPSSFFGQFIGIVAERLSLIWQAMQDVYLSQSPVTAFGASLDNVGALVGIPRLQATFSTVANYRLFGTPGTPIPTFTQFSVIGTPTSIFQTTGLVTLGAGQNCLQNIAFSGVAASGNWQLSLYGSNTATLPFNATAAQVQLAIRGLPFCGGCVVIGSMLSGFAVNFLGVGTGGLMVQPVFTLPPSTNTLETAGLVPISITPSITTPGIDQANVALIATVTGPLIANVDTLTNIVTPVNGLTLALNTQDATIGTNLETDNAYRTRIAQEQQVAGAGTVEAIRSRLRTVSGVTSCLVFENTSDVTIENAEYVGDDLPPHSFEAFVGGTATEADIAAMLWLVKPTGIATYGALSLATPDSQGVDHTMFWSQPVIVPIYVQLSMLTNSKFPANGNVTAQTILVNYLNGLGQGNAVIIDPYMIAQLAAIPGIDDATILLSLDNVVFSGANIPMTAVQEAFSQASFVAITSTPG